MLRFFHFLIFSAQFSNSVHSSKYDNRISKTNSKTKCPCNGNEAVCYVEGKVYMRRKIRLLKSRFADTDDRTLDVELAVKIKGHSALDFLLFPNETSIDVTWLPTNFDTQISERLPPVFGPMMHYKNEAKKKSRIITNLQFSEVNMRMNSTFDIRIMSIYHPLCGQLVPFIPPPSVTIDFSCENVKGRPCAQASAPNLVMPTTEMRHPNCNLSPGFNTKVIESESGNEVRISFDVPSNVADSPNPSHLIAFYGICDGNTNDVFAGKCELDISNASTKRLCLPEAKCRARNTERLLTLHNVTTSKVGVLLCAVHNENHEWPREISRSNLTIADQILVSLPPKSVSTPIFRSFGAYVIIAGAVIVFFLYVFSQRIYTGQKVFSLNKRPGDPWEFDEEEVDVDFDDALSCGQFASVYGGFIAEDIKVPSSGSCLLDNHQKVAVKVMRTNAPVDYRNRFLAEIAILKTIGRHSRIVNLIGVVTKSSPLCLITEYCANGDMKSYLGKRFLYMNTLHNRKINLNDPYLGDEVEFSMIMTISDVMKFASHVIAAMEYLHSQSIVHRNINSSHIMVSADHSAKIGGFHAAQKEGDPNNFHRTHNETLPFQWMAPESLKNFFFGKPSDVWSFGVLLYELITVGGAPYPSVQSNQILCHLKRGNRLKRPDGCGEKLYSLMCECWAFDPSKRPTFEEIRRRLLMFMDNNEGRGFITIDPTSEIYSEAEDQSTTCQLSVISED